MFWLVPIIVVGFIANARRRSLHHCWWPVFLGVIGLIIAAIILVSKEPGEAS